MQSILGIDMACINVGPSQITRSQRDAQRDGSAYYFLIGQRASQAHILHQNRSALLNPGDMVVVDSSQQSEFIYTGSGTERISDQVSVHIPRQMLEEGFARRHVGEKILAQSDLAQCVWQQLAAVHALADVLQDSRLQTRDFESLFLRTFLQAFSEHKHQNKFVKVVQSLLMNVDEHGCTVEHFAEITYSSRRTFFRIFEDRNISFGELLKYIRLLRFLQLCKATPIYSRQPSVAAMAYQAGFTDISNFNRLFKSTFGVAPGVLVTKC
jgi:AraC family transcriptional activator of tynA and feaB